MKVSLTRRLLLASSLVLLLFLGLAGWSLDQAARQQARTALEARLLGQVYALLGAAEENERGLPRMPESLPDPLLQQPDSGLYAQVSGSTDGYRWRSASLLGRHLQPSGGGRPGEPYYSRRDGFLQLDLVVEWEDIDTEPHPYRITVAYDLDPLVRQSREFRRVLWQWLGGAGVLLLAAQLWLLRWGLKPVAGLAADLAALEDGRLQRLTRPVPEELAGLRDNLNSLIQHNQVLIERNRNRLADLAHSLKTPLSVLAASVDDKDPGQLLEHARIQLPRMNELVEHHLQRASLSGAGFVGAPIDILAELRAILSALGKIHRQRGIEVQLRFPEHARLRMDKGDFYELAGNLLENAFKYCHSCIRVHVQTGDVHLLLQVEDDGPGIESGQLARLLRRGERADQRSPGQGIGLSMVEEIVTAYQGRFSLSRSDLGGARFSLFLPVSGAAMDRC